MAGITEIEEFVIASNTSQYRKCLSEKYDTYQTLVESVKVSFFATNIHFLQTQNKKKNLGYSSTTWVQVTYQNVPSR